MTKTSYISFAFLACLVFLIALPSPVHAAAMSTTNQATASNAGCTGTYMNSFTSLDTSQLPSDYNTPGKYCIQKTDTFSSDCFGNNEADTITYSLYSTDGVTSKATLDVNTCGTLNYNESPFLTPVAYASINGHISSTFYSVIIYRQVTATLTGGTSINSGGSTLLTWSSNLSSGSGVNFGTCTGTNFSTGGAVSGSVSVSPTQTTTYTVTCSLSSGNSSASASQTVTVVPPLSSSTLSCSASPTTANVGQTVTWTGQTTGGTAPYDYSFTGDNLLGYFSGFIQSLTYSTTTVYSSSGTKHAAVTVTDSSGTPGYTSTITTSHCNQVCTGTYTGYSSPSDQSGQGPGPLTNGCLANPYGGNAYEPPDFSTNPQNYCEELAQTTYGCAGNQTCVPNVVWETDWYSGNGVGSPPNNASNTVTNQYESWTFAQNTTSGTPSVTGTVTCSNTVTVVPPYVSLSVGSLNAQNVALADTTSNFAISNAVKKVFHAVSQFIIGSIAYATTIFTGQPVQLTVPITNSSNISTTTPFTNFYFIDVGNDSTAQPGDATTSLSGAPWDLMYATTSDSGIGANAVLNSSVRIGPNAYSTNGLPPGNNAVVFCADWYGRVSDPAQSKAARCTQRIVQAVTSGVDLTAGAVSPTSAYAGIANTISALISNIGSDTTGTGFSNLLQWASSCDGSGNCTNVTDAATDSVSALAASPATETTSFSYTFSLPNTPQYIAHDQSQCSGTAIGSVTDNEPTANLGAPDQAGTGQATALTASDMQGEEGAAEMLGLLPPSDFNTNPQNYCFQVRTRNTLNSGSWIYTWFSGNGYAANADNVNSYGVQAFDIATFASAPGTQTQYLRVCADKKSASDSGTIPESNENNNCGSWTPVSVSSICYGGGCSPSGSPTTPGPGGVCQYPNATQPSANPFQCCSVSPNVCATVPPPPSAQLSASPVTITTGGSSTLTWSSLNSQTCTGSPTNFTAGATQGSLTVNPSSTTTYSITCTDAYGNNTFATMQVNVITANISISATPSQLRKGDAVSVSWSATGSALTSCTESGPGLSASTFSGSLSGLVIQNESIYTLSCLAGSLSVSTSTKVRLIPKPQEF